MRYRREGQMGAGIGGVVLMEAEVGERNPKTLSTPAISHFRVSKRLTAWMSEKRAW